MIIDDDLGEIFDQLADGVSLTAFFDSCHSGDGMRRLKLLPTDVQDLNTASAPHGRRARYVIPDRETSEKYRAKRGAPARAGKRSLAREVLFSACKPTEVAFETGGHGDFTGATSLLVVPSANRLTNGEFLAKIREAFSSQPRQNPDFYGPRAAKSRVFLAPLVAVGTEPADLLPGAPSGTIPAAMTALLDPGVTGGIDALAAAASAAGSAGTAAGRQADAADRARAAAAFLRAAADFIDG